MTMAAVYLRATLALSTLIAGALLFRSEAQHWLEHRNEQAAIAPASPLLTSQLLDQKRLQRFGDRLVYFDPKQAAEALQEALKLAPLDASTWSRLSLAQFYAGDDVSANRSARHALQLAPNSAHVAFEQALLAADFWEHAAAATQMRWQINLDHLMSEDALGLARYSRETQRAERLCNIAAPQTRLADLCAGRHLPRDKH